MAQHAEKNVSTDSWRRPRGAGRQLFLPRSRQAVDGRVNPIVVDMQAPRSRVATELWKKLWTARMESESRLVHRRADGAV